MAQVTSPSSNSTGLDDSVSSFTQTVNQGMGAVGDTAADIEIYMGEQSNEMVKSSVMGGSKPGVMGGSKPGVMGGSSSNNKPDAIGEGSK
jgi:hypothetical protein